MSISESGSEFDYCPERDAISISQLSTACLGADVRVKHDTDDLEPSCTFHVFPNEYALDDRVSVLNTRGVTWTSANALKDRPQARNNQSGIKTARAESSPSSLTNRNKMIQNDQFKRSQSDGRLDLPAIYNDPKGKLVVSDIQLGEQAKFEHENPVPADREDEIVEIHEIRRPRQNKSQTLRYVPEEKVRQMKCLRQKFSGYYCNTKNNSQKSNNVPTRTEEKKTTQNVKKTFTKDVQETTEMPVPSPILQYLKSNEDRERVQSSQTERTLSSKRRIADQRSIEKVAEYLLCEKNILIGGSPREPPGIKTELPMEPEGVIYVHFTFC